MEAFLKELIIETSELLAVQDGVLSICKGEQERTRNLWMALYSIFGKDLFECISYLEKSHIQVRRIKKREGFINIYSINENIVMVDSMYCSCKKFTERLISSFEALMCSHILACSFYEKVMPKDLKTEYADICQISEIISRNI